MHLNVPESPARVIIDYGMPGCKKSVQEWTQRVLQRSDDVPQGCRFRWGNSTSTAVLFDAIMCNTWYADHLLEDSLKPDASVLSAKQASAHYAYVLRELWPRWTHRPAEAQKDALTTERCTQGKYCLSRGVQFDKLLALAQKKNYSVNLQRQLQVNAAHMYGNCAQLIPEKHKEYWDTAVLRSAAALETWSQHFINTGAENAVEHVNAWGSAAACLAEAATRYAYCNMQSDVERCKQLRQDALNSNCVTHNAPEVLPDWNAMKPSFHS